MAKRGRGRPRKTEAIRPPSERSSSKKPATAKGLKKLVVFVIEKKHEFYGQVSDLIVEHHEDLSDAKIVLAWRMGWREDVDGNVRLTQVVKANELGKELGAYDFAILLSHEFFNSARCTAEHRAYLFDDALSRCARAEGKGGPKEDEKNRPVWRTRKPEFSGFVGVVKRHGPVMEELASLARELRAFDGQETLPFPKEPTQAAAATPA